MSVPDVSAVVNDDDHRLVDWEQTFDVLVGHTWQRVRQVTTEEMVRLTATLIPAEYTTTKEGAVGVDGSADLHGVGTGAHRVDMHLILSGQVVQKGDQAGSSSVR